MKTKFLVRIIFVSLIFSAILFLCAGRINYFQGWIFFATNGVTSFMTFLAGRNDADLMKERSQIAEGAKSWDKIILGLSSLTYLAFLVVAGLDSGRYRWSPDFHWSVYVLGIILTLAGQLLFLAAKRENKYFSSVVRIQTDRGHTVCNTGVYKIVRHPGYLGMTISLAALPLITGSVWGAIPTALGIILLFIRTRLEDETLKNELPGYVEFTRSTQWRLIPKIW